MSEPKKVGRPSIGTDNDPLVTLTVTVRKSDLAHLATVNRNLSKAIRQLIDQHRKETTNDPVHHCR